MFLFKAPVSILYIRMYAICILIGILIAVYLGIKEGKKLGIYSDFIYYGVIITLPVAIIGARLWYILFNLNDEWSFSKIIGLDGGLAGLAVQGGILAALICIYVYCKKKDVSLYKVFDIVAPGFFIGQICGRWGNFFNKELYGPIVKNVTLFKHVLPSFITNNMFIDGFYRHPTFLYEGLLNLVGLIIMLVLRRKFKKLRSGDMMGIYLCWYGMVRIFTEILRSKSDANEVLMLGNIKVSVLISVLFIISGILFLVLKTFYGPKTYYQDIILEVENNKIDTVLFDLDGTLLDTKRLIEQSFIYTFAKYFKDYKLSDEELDSFFGPTLYESFSKYTDDQDLIKEMIEYYRSFSIENHNKDYIKPFYGAVDTLKLLKKKGYKLGIVSSKTKSMILLGLDLYDMSKYFDVIISCDDVEKYKPDPEGILKAIEILKPLKNVLYIGDNVSDIQAGISANVKTCDVMYSSNFEKCEELKPTYCIKDLPGLIKILVE